MAHDILLLPHKSIAGFTFRFALVLLTLTAGNVSICAQQKPKRNAEVIVTLDACAPDVTYQPGFANGDNNGTLNLYIQRWGNTIINETWNGNPSGGIVHTGARHIKIQPYHDYQVTLTRLGQPMSWGEIKFSAPPGYAVFINGVARESFKVVPADLTNGIFSFTVREVGDGGLLPAGMALPPDVADFVWTMSTGTYANGMPLTPVQLRAQSLSAGMLSPTALTFLHPYSPEVGYVQHSDGGVHEAIRLKFTVLGPSGPARATAPTPTANSRIANSGSAIPTAPLGIIESKSRRSTAMAAQPLRKHGR
jgi:hypothetical protein